MEFYVDYELAFNGTQEWPASSEEEVREKFLEEVHDMVEGGTITLFEYRITPKFDYMRDALFINTFNDGVEISAPCRIDIKNRTVVDFEGSVGCTFSYIPYKSEVEVDGVRSLAINYEEYIMHEARGDALPRNTIYLWG